LAAKYVIFCPGERNVETLHACVITPVNVHGTEGQKVVGMTSRMQAIVIDLAFASQVGGEAE
jgi:hypothetical protein